MSIIEEKNEQSQNIWNKQAQHFWSTVQSLFTQQNSLVAGNVIRKLEDKWTGATFDFFKTHIFPAFGEEDTVHVTHNLGKAIISKLEQFLKKQGIHYLHKNDCKCLKCQEHPHAKKVMIVCICKEDECNICNETKEVKKVSTMKQEDSFIIREIKQIRKAKMLEFFDSCVMPQFAEEFFIERVYVAHQFKESLEEYLKAEKIGYSYTQSTCTHECRSSTICIPVPQIDEYACNHVHDKNCKAYDFVFSLCSCQKLDCKLCKN